MFYELCKYYLRFINCAICIYIYKLYIFICLIIHLDEFYFNKMTHFISNKSM
jgi:hypothetical protein